MPHHGGVAQGFLLIPVSGVDDAEGRVREQVGEEKIGGNGQNGTHPRETFSEMERFWDTRNTWQSLSVEPHVQSSRVRCAREKCAYACVRWGVLCTPPSHSRLLLLPERGICRKKSARLHWKAGLSGWSGLHRFPCCLFPFFWTQIPPILVLPPMRVPFLPLMLQDDELHHVGLYDQLEDDDDGCWLSEFFGCTKYSAQWKLSHSKNFLTSGSSVLFWGVFDVHGIWGTPCLSACWRLLRALAGCFFVSRALTEWSCLFV